MHVLHRFSHILLLITLGIANAAWAYPEYRVTVVGPASSSVSDINNDGVVTGNYYVNNSSPRGFVNRGKGVVYLGMPGGTSSKTVAINDKGRVLGEWTTGAGETRGFIYRAGKGRDIGAIPGRGTKYTDINNRGFIIAQGSLPDNFDLPRSFLRAPDGTFTDIGALPFEDPITYANALSNNNAIAGASGPLTFPDQPLRAIYWSKGVMRDLGDFGWAPNYGQAINDHGQITGSMSVQGVFRDRIAFLHSKGRLIDIDGRSAKVERSSAGAGINIHGHVVGASDHLAAFVYRGKRMQSLNALIDPKKGWNINDAQAINDAGQIAANAIRNGVQYAVRLDLIRPMLMRAPELETEDGVASAPATNGEDEAKDEDKADAEAQSREVTHPVPQL